MNNNWLRQIKVEIKPSVLFSQEIKRSGECDSNELIDILLGEILPEGDVGATLDILEIN